jgi:hypothetical protein
VIKSAPARFEIEQCVTRGLLDKRKRAPKRPFVGKGADASPRIAFLQVVGTFAVVGEIEPFFLRFVGRTQADGHLQQRQDHKGYDA